MLKRITLFLYVVFNLNIYSQVVIKDEIVLDEIMPDAVTLSTVTPAYGRLDLWYVINPTYYRSKVTAQIGDLAVFVYGQTYDCPGSGGNTGDYVHMHWFDIPAGTTINMEVLTCINEQWANCPVSFGAWEQDGDFYYLDYTVQYGGNNNESRILETNHLRIWAYLPPQCCLLESPCVNLCQEPFESPDLDIHPESDPNICNEISDPAAGAFKGLYWNLRDGEALIVEPCQRPSTGEIKFVYATNFTTNIYLPYNLELCPDKIAYKNLRRIDDMSSFENYLSEIRQTISLEQACTIRGWIIDHKGIDENGNQTEYEFLSQDGIWLTAHTLAHEEEHRRDYENELNNAKNIFYEFFSNYSVTCSTYKSDPENAKLVAEGWYKSKLKDFSNQAQLEYDTKLNEVEVNGRPDVLDSITPYLSEFDKFCRKKWGEDTYWNTIKLCN
jgi:hypothetical protein